MRVALVNPPWSFDGSRYSGCREPHSPLELAYTRQLLEQRGHVVRLLDAPMAGADLGALENELWSYRADVMVITTAPSCLFWRCAPPELRVPSETARVLRPYTQRLFAVGPHASSTPGAVLHELGADAVVLGECEAVLPALVEAAPADYGKLASIAYRAPGSDARDANSALVVQGPQATMDLQRLPAVRWQRAEVAAHRHHHHRFDCAPSGPGAELEASRGCPHAGYRTRPLRVLLEELDRLIANGVRYVYFIDDTFMPNRALLEALLERDVQFGVQLRLDNWSEELLDMLGRAGCVSIEARVESITAQGRRRANKPSKLSTAQLTQRLLHAKRAVPFVQANLLAAGDDPQRVARWREELGLRGVWSSRPAPASPYPGSQEYRLHWGELDELARQRAHDQRRQERTRFSQPLE